MIESPVRTFHPMENPLIIRSESSKLSEEKMFFLGNDIFVQATSRGIQFQPSLPGSSNASRPVVYLDYQEFRQLLEFSNVLKSALRKRPSHAKTLVKHDVLFRHQTKFMLGKTLYCKVSHLENESEIQFIEYMMVNSVTVPDER